MNFEVLKRSNLKRNIIIGVVVVAIITAVVITFSRASYKSVAKVDLVDGVINYSLADFNVIAMYQQKEDSDEYEPVDEVPSSGYTLSDQSQCTVNGDTDSDITITYADGKVTFTGVTKKGTKCYLYFDIGESLCPSGATACETILANVTVNDDTPDFSVTAITDEGVYTATDNDGTSYYFRGAVTNNYVKFAEYYWRIIRINGDGSIRLIYQGSSPTDTGQIGTSYFNSSTGGSYYVGYTYTANQQRPDSTTSGENSTIKDALETWYSGSNGISNYDSYITSEAGFCNDRTTYTSSGVATDWTGTYDYYGAYVRLSTNKTPILECDEGDLYKTKVGLITADEVAMAGGVYGSSNTNTSYYLYTGASTSFWTMSPYLAASGANASVFVVVSDGRLLFSLVTGGLFDGTYGVRPVINLRADVTISDGDGSSTNPFVVAT